MSPKFSSLAFDEKEYDCDQDNHGCETGLKLIKSHQNEASIAPQAQKYAVQISGRITISF